jgi:hypothetical protein
VQGTHNDSLKRRAAVLLAVVPLLAGCHHAAAPEPPAPLAVHLTYAAGPGLVSGEHLTFSVAIGNGTAPFVLHWSIDGATPALAVQTIVGRSSTLEVELGGPAAMSQVWRWLMAPA